MLGGARGIADAPPAASPIWAVTLIENPTGAGFLVPVPPLRSALYRTGVNRARSLGLLGGLMLVMYYWVAGGEGTNPNRLLRESPGKRLAHTSLPRITQEQSDTH